MGCRYGSPFLLTYILYSDSDHFFTRTGTGTGFGAGPNTALSNFSSIVIAQRFLIVLA